MTTQIVSVYSFQHRRSDVLRISGHCEDPQRADCLPCEQFCLFCSQQIRGGSLTVVFFWGFPLCLTSLKLANSISQPLIFTVKATLSYPFLQFSYASHSPSFPSKTQTFRVPGSSFLPLHFLSLLLLYHFTTNSVRCHCQIGLLIVS